MTSVTLWVSDLDATARFYGDCLGVDLGEAHRHEGNEALHYDLGWGDFESGEFVLLHLCQADGDRTTGGAGIGWSVDDLEAIHARATGLGIPVVAPPHDAPWGRTATYEDPDGNRVSLTQGG